MARYIDADKIHEFVDAKVAEGKDGWEKGVPYEWAYALTVIDMQPTADVVPKSEYDAVVSALDNSTKEFLKLHDDYQEAKREDYKWMCRCREWHEVAAEKSKLVREIFAEIDKILKSCPTEIMGRAYYYKCIVDEDYAELKKKYTEGKT